MKTSDLKPGQSLLNRVRKVKGGMFEIQVAEIVANPNAPENILSDLHMGDERFDVGRKKARLGWTTANAASLKAHFGIDVETLTYDENGCAEVEILNPSIRGNRLALQLVDSFEKSYDSQNPKLFTRGEEKFVFVKEGKAIYQSTKIVAAKDVKHTIISSDERIPYAQYSETVGASESSLAAE